MRWMVGDYKDKKDVQEEYIMNVMARVEIILWLVWGFQEMYIQNKDEELVAVDYKINVVDAIKMEIGDGTSLWWSRGGGWFWEGEECSCQVEGLVFDYPTKEE